jgi:hypothetical protein
MAIERELEMTESREEKADHLIHGYGRMLLMQP